MPKSDIPLRDSSVDRGAMAPWRHNGA